MKLRHIFSAGMVIMLGLSSCDDFLTIYPNDRTIAPDFWKTKADVQEMATGCYHAMINGDIMERVIMWGGFRSDEIIKNEDYNSTELDNINAVNLLPTQSIISWRQFYNVINRCNVVLTHAPEVMDVDPEYTVGDNQVIRGQMLALRSLCYFYLVRAFRDVPFSTEAFESDNQELYFPQSAPDSVLRQCIADLKEAEGIIMKSGAYGENAWENVGFITRDAVNAILADIYLWRASMTKSRSDYEQVVVCADKIIKAKDEYFKKTNRDRVTNLDPTDIYHLFRGTEANANIFGTEGRAGTGYATSGNSRESILEWQYDGTNNANTVLANFYDRQGEGSIIPRLKASKIFRTPDANANSGMSESLYMTEHDIRYWNNVYDAGPGSEDAGFAIRKMVDRSGVIFSNETRDRSKAGNNNRTFGSYQQNWIVYRLTDIMLMKAEALVELAADDEDEEHLEGAFNMVQQVNKRSLQAAYSTDTLKFDNFKSKDRMELLVLNERERELCFEGKRWFDLMRYNYRHVEGVDITKRMGDEDYEAPEVYAKMLDLIVRKYEGSGDAVKYKMKTEPYLYWPVSESETKVNSQLMQNPVWKQEETIKKVFE